MKKTTVERMYTTKVAELLNQGWHIHTSTMPGHQGEIAHVDLTDGSEIRRVLLCRERTWGNSYTDFYGAKIIITVGKNTDRIRSGWDSTLWNNHIEVCSRNSTSFSWKDGDRLFSGSSSRKTPAPLMLDVKNSSAVSPFEAGLRK